MEGSTRQVWLPQDSRLQECLHESGYDAREKIIGSLGVSREGRYTRQARRLASCCSAVRFYVDPRAGKVRPWVCRCRDRLCPFCSRARASAVTRQLAEAMEKIERPRMLVLTVKSRDRPLGEQLRALRKWFKRLRASVFWKARVRGGVYTVEVTRNVETGLWHPHLHIVFDGEYLPQKALRFVWHRITQGSEVVWVQDVSDRRGAAVELAKYVAKPARIARWGQSAIREYAVGVAGARMVQSFGCCYNPGIADVDLAAEESPDAFQVSLQRMVWLGRCGVEPAQRLSLLVAARWPVFGSYIYHELPQLRPERTQTEKTGELMRMLSGRSPPDEVGVSERRVAELADAKIFLAFAEVRRGEVEGEYALVDLVNGFAE